MAPLPKRDDQEASKMMGRRAQAHQRDIEAGYARDADVRTEATAVPSDQSIQTQEYTPVTQSSCNKKASGVVILATIPIGAGGVPSTITTVKTPQNDQNSSPALSQRWKPRPTWPLAVGLVVVVLLALMVVFSVRATSSASKVATTLTDPSPIQPVAEGAENRITLAPSQVPLDDYDCCEELDDAWRDDQMEQAADDGED
jgi:hypothetical protein